MSSKLDGKSREPSIKETRGEHIQLINNKTDLVQTAKGNEKDRIAPENMKDARNPSPSKNDENQKPQTRIKSLTE